MEWKERFSMTHWAEYGVRREGRREGRIEDRVEDRIEYRIEG